MVAYREYTGVIRLIAGHGEGANLSAPIVVSTSLDETYLHFVCRGRPQGRPLAEVTEAHEEPNLGGFADAVERAARMASGLPIGERLEIARRSVRECLRGREWVERGFLGGEWKMRMNELLLCMQL